MARHIRLIKGYFRKDGTPVRPHLRTRPDGNPYNNLKPPKKPKRLKRIRRIRSL